MIPGAECHSNDPWEHEAADSRDPGDWIPVSLPGQQTDEDAIAIPENPDIRVPNGIKREDALRACCTLRRKDHKEEGEAECGAGAEKRPDHTEEAEQAEASPGDKPKGREGPEEPERRHVPGGTWLRQVRSYLKDSFRLTKGREEAEGGEGREEREEGREDKKGRGKDFQRGT
ncbi:hypothetical protein NDU88_001495 [Pleurodeles waltl]|uniref:Uncharacterized protein n=1 Tax=Pleurodeles waltl TaxID=8319 RepID=A0AAV7MMV1_PLEWA|nr:hypothetical protein NDU88_001495 [Pleurodeles waltl]